MPYPPRRGRTWIATVRRLLERGATEGTSKDPARAGNEAARSSRRSIHSTGVLLHRRSPPASPGSPGTCAVDRFQVRQCLLVETPVGDCCTQSRLKSRSIATVPTDSSATALGGRRRSLPSARVGVTQHPRCRRRVVCERDRSEQYVANRVLPWLEQTEVELARTRSVAGSGESVAVSANEIPPYPPRAGGRCHAA
jgi:hypothetical protein